MKVNIEIFPEISEAELVVKTRSVDEEVTDLLRYLQSKETFPLYGRKGGKHYRIDRDNIVRVYAQDKNVYIKLDNGKEVLVDYRLYELESLFLEEFVRISKSELINIKKIEYFELEFTGSIKICFPNKDFTYSSRRYLKQIKEKLKV